MKIWNNVSVSWDEDNKCRIFGLVFCINELCSAEGQTIGYRIYYRSPDQNTYYPFLNPRTFPSVREVKEYFEKLIHAEMRRVLKPITISDEQFINREEILNQGVIIE